MNSSSSSSMPNDGSGDVVAQAARQQPRRRRRPPRKFVIQSTFGQPRQPRSRKNRPCDACRRRKTACVITADPPCQSCRRRGIPCQSTPVNDAQGKRLSAVVQDSAHDTVQAQRFASGSQLTDSLNTQTPITDRASRTPVHSATSSYASPALYQRPISCPPCSDPAVLVHQNFVHNPLTPSTVDTEAVRTSVPTDPIILSSPYTLEDIPGQCAYFMGQPSEQDGFFLDSFRYGILRDNFNLSANVVQVQPRSISSTAENSPIHFLLLRIDHPDHVKSEKQHISDAIEAKAWPYGDNLVRLFFRHVHPVFPIVSKVRFLNRYHNDKKQLPACLRGAVYALASVFWNYDIALKDTPMPFRQHELVDYAHRVLRREMENPNLFILQACLLLQHVTPPALDTLEAPTTWTSAAQATACAQMIGLHVEPREWNINATEKHLRRKLWWATVYADCWSSMCHGNPSHISSASYTTTTLTMEDIRCDEDAPADVQYLLEVEDRRFQVSTGARFLEMVNLARLLRTVQDGNYQVNASMQPVNNSMKTKAELLAVEAKLKDWATLIPSCLDVTQQDQGSGPIACYNCSLHLSFYTLQVVVYRALMHPSTQEAKLKPDSNLRRWFSEALLACAGFADFLLRLNKDYLAGFWGRHARSQFVLCGNFLVFLFLLASERRDIERAYGFLETFYQAMNDCWDTSDEQITTLLQAAKDRIDSFFSQAAEIMRRGTDEGVPALQSG